MGERAGVREREGERDREKQRDRETERVKGRGKKIAQHAISSILDMTLICVT